VFGGGGGSWDLVLGLGFVGVLVWLLWWVVFVFFFFWGGCGLVVVGFSLEGLPNTADFSWPYV